jgi:hypothetical protein
MTHLIIPAFMSAVILFVVAGFPNPRRAGSSTGAWADLAAKVAMAGFVLLLRYADMASVWAQAVGWLLVVAIAYAAIRLLKRGEAARR